MKRPQRTESANSISSMQSPQPKKQKVPEREISTTSPTDLKNTSSLVQNPSMEDGQKPKVKAAPKTNGDSDPAAAEAERLERRKQKKRRKEMEKQMLESNSPVFKYLVAGLKHRREPVSIDGVRDFALSLLSDIPPQPWIIAENPKAISHVLALLIPGILPSHIVFTSDAPPKSVAMPLELKNLRSPDPSKAIEPTPVTLLPVLHTLFSHACPTKAPGETQRLHSVVGQFLQCPITGDQQKIQQERRIALSRQTVLKPSDFVLTLSQMKENDFPMPTYLRSTFDGGPPSPIDMGEALPKKVPKNAHTPTVDSKGRLEEGWVETPRVVEGEPKYTLLALDCEMCVTSAGSELTRVSVIDGVNNVVIYDAMAKPDLPIIDYMTQYSGITAKKLEGVTRRLADVQRDFLRFLHPQTILLGHSLENDLRTLKIAHPRVADTSVMYHHPRGAPFKPGLKWLANKWMQKQIQRMDGVDSEEGGHDPEEDARTCAELFWLKIQKGWGFGEFQQDIESIFQKLARPSSRRQAGATAAVVDYGTPHQWHGAKAKTSVACKSDEEVLEGVMDTIDSHDFVFARFMELSNALGWTTDKSNKSFPMSDVHRGCSPPDHPASPEDEISQAFTNLNDRLARLHRSLPRSTAVILMTGHSDPRPIVQLNARRTRWEMQWKQLQDIQKIPKEDWWTTEDDRKMVMEVEKAKHGLAFFCITRQPPQAKQDAT